MNVNNLAFIGVLAILVASPDLLRPVQGTDDSGQRQAWILGFLPMSGNAQKVRAACASSLEAAKRTVRDLPDHCYIPSMAGKFSDDDLNNIQKCIPGGIQQKELDGVVQQPEQSYSDSGYSSASASAGSGSASASAGGASASAGGSSVASVSGGFSSDDTFGGGFGGGSSSSSSSGSNAYASAGGRRRLRDSSAAAASATAGSASATAGGTSSVSATAGTLGSNLGQILSAAQASIAALV